MNSGVPWDRVTKYMLLRGYSASKTGKGGGVKCVCRHRNVAVWAVSSSTLCSRMDS